MSDRKISKLPKLPDQKTFEEPQYRPPVISLRAQVIDGPDSGKVATATERLSIGTAPSNQLVLADSTVSRFHVELTREQGYIFVSDKGSTNGTDFGGALLTSARIKPGAILKLGRTRVRIENGDPVHIELHEGEALGRLIGVSTVMRQLMLRIKKAAQSNSSALIIGETGVGKEVVARSLHDNSPRAQHPFETVDCGSMMPNLIASELFGHERGAFTGADSLHIGAFERARGGTIFLDEIGELPLPLQTNLLSALERREIRRLGGKQSIPIDIRVVSATNRDLRTEVNQDRFRQDLFFRLAVLQLTIPPLRERLEDIPPLVQHFLEALGHFQPLEETFPSAALEMFSQHHWPGNVRELRNVVEASLVLGEPPPLGRLSSPKESSTETSFALSKLLDIPYNEARAELIDALEDQYFRHLLTEVHWNVSEAARRAKMNRSYLVRLISKRGLKRPKD